MIIHNQDTLFMVFGKGTLVLVGGVVENIDTKKKYKSFGIEDNSDNPLPLGIDPNIEGFKFSTMPIKLIFDSNAAIDNFIVQLEALKSFDIKMAEERSDS